MNDRGTRRFSQAISEGDGISVIAAVGDAAAARSAEQQGAEGIAVERLDAAVREATTLPIFWRGAGSLREAREAGADACLLSTNTLGDDPTALEDAYAAAKELGLDCVIEACNEEELELALERIDPEIFLLSPRAGEDQEESLDHVLDLLPDVPAGKLAIADLPITTREEALALERAGIDAVISQSGNVAELVGDESPVA